MLAVDWWGKQIEVAEALLCSRRVFVKASHSVGKSFLAGGLVNWFFDCFDPGICITTAPNAPQVRDILWKEVRVQRPTDLRGALQPKAPRMESGPDHFAVGYTSRDGSGFQGRHEEHVLIVFDECVGVAGNFWDAAEGMMTGESCFFLALCNPTDTGSRAYAECQNTEKWRVIEISALEHPNIAADLAGEPAPYQKAVRLGWVRGKLKEWCGEVYPQISQISQMGNGKEEEDGKGRKGGDLTPYSLASPYGSSDSAREGGRAGDFQFPVGSGRWYRPGPLFESRVLGRWPSQGSASVWTEAIWAETVIRRAIEPVDAVAIGCDVARFGDDFTSMVVRRGGAVLHHETHNGWSTVQTAGRLKQLTAEFNMMGEDGRRIEVLVDDDGVGGGVVDQADGYCFLAVSGAERAVARDAYPNRRSELWFGAAERAADGRLDLSRLGPESLRLIQRQVMAPTWKLDSQGRRVVEAKAETKRRIGRSPDDADALNLAFSTAPRLVADASMWFQFWREEEDSLTASTCGP